MENSVFQRNRNGLKGGDENSHPEKETNATVRSISNCETATTSKFGKPKECSSNNGLSFRVPLKTLNGSAVNSKDTKPVEKKSRKGCVAEVVVWKGRVNNFITPQPPKKLPQNAPGQLFVVSYPDVDVPLSQRQKDPPKTKTILKKDKDKLVRKSEPKLRIDTGGGQRRIPRTTKQPKKFKFISVEEHHQLLQEYIKNASKKALDEKENKENINTDFRLDSLFKQENDQNPPSTATKAVETVTTSSASCSTEVSNVLQQSIQSTSFPVSNELSVAMDESCHSHMDDSGVSQHSFPVDSGDICNIDDVARYELVESTEFSSVDFEAFAALGTISTFGNGNVRRPSKIPRMQQQRRKSVSATTTTEDENGTRTIDIVVDETGKPRCTYTELIEKALTEAGDLTVSEIYQWISNKYPFFRPEDDRWKNSVRHNLSINPYFKKGEKSRGGAGHLWTISEESKGMRPNYKRKSNENLYELELCMPMESDTDRAVASILGQYNLARANQLQQEQNTVIDDICKEAPPQEQQVPTESVECPDDILIGYDSLPPGTYTLELNGLQLETENLFDLDTISQTGYVIVSKDDSNKENLENMANIMDEVSALAHFPYINENCNSGLTESSNITFENIPDVDGKKNSFNRDLNNRGEYFPMPDPPICQQVLEEKHPLTPDSSNELLLLESIGASSSVALDEVMEATCSSEDPLPIMSESLFDAKELGMIYQYEEDVPRD